MSIRPIKLTLTAELDDGRIIEILIPFSLPAEIELQADQSRELLGSKNSSHASALTEMAPYRG